MTNYRQDYEIVLHGSMVESHTSDNSELDWK